ncbi:hypothetical protein GX50_00358 [[Emmonsia] crescens]|uniref:Uncharacterized protein n=1 Tax=[Emmonsia] crescens TaxID=73230 RepID=A0A2B7ZU15_9EURO|nr:hypothetical protein GX50_00358 [Emmonsia crescens]
MTSQFSPHASPSHSQKAATSHSTLPSHHQKTHLTTSTTTTTTSTTSTSTSIDTNIPTSSRTSNPEQGSKKDLPLTPTSPSTSQWQPKLDRTQSWNEQDMKHRFQQRLTGLEKGRESGFTEIEREIKEGAMGGGAGG